SETLVRDDDVGVRGDLVHRRVDDLDVAAERAQPLLELVRADEARAHPGLAGEHDETHVNRAFDDHEPSPSSTPTGPAWPVGVASRRRGTLGRNWGRPRSGGPGRLGLGLLVELFLPHGHEPEDRRADREGHGRRREYPEE